MYKTKKQSGFTLIELLVVISIVGLLASITLTSLNGARKKARDAKRMGDLRQMNTAMQLYIQDVGHAPYVGALNCNTSNTGNPDCYTVNSAEKTYWGYLQTDLQSYISKLPTDPCGQACNSGDRWAVYIYQPPSNIALWCGCGTSASEKYSIYAGLMETANTNYNLTYQGFPTFGFLNSSLLGVGSQ